jgi:hypothetical protein
MSAQEIYNLAQQNWIKGADTEAIDKLGELAYGKEESDERAKKILELLQQIIKDIDAAEAALEEDDDLDGAKQLYEKAQTLQTSPILDNDWETPALADLERRLKHRSGDVESDESQGDRAQGELEPDDGKPNDLPPKNNEDWQQTRIEMLLRHLSEPNLSPEEEIAKCQEVMSEEDNDLDGQPLEIRLLAAQGDQAQRGRQFKEAMKFYKQAWNQLPGGAKTWRDTPLEQRLQTGLNVAASELVKDHLPTWKNAFEAGNYQKVKKEIASWLEWLPTNRELLDLQNQCDEALHKAQKYQQQQEKVEHKIDKAHQLLQQGELNRVENILEALLSADLADMPEVADMQTRVQEQQAKRDELLKDAGRLMEELEFKQAKNKYAQAQELDGESIEAQQGFGDASRNADILEKIDQTLTNVQEKLDQGDWRNAKVSLEDAETIDIHHWKTGKITRLQDDVEEIKSQWNTDVRTSELELTTALNDGTIWPETIFYWDRYNQHEPEYPAVQIGKWQDFFQAHLNFLSEEISTGRDLIFRNRDKAREKLEHILMQWHSYRDREELKRPDIAPQFELVTKRLDQVKKLLALLDDAEKAEAGLNSVLAQVEATLTNGENPRATLDRINKALKVEKRHDPESDMGKLLQPTYRRLEDKRDQLRNLYIIKVGGALQQAQTSLDINQYAAARKALKLLNPDRLEKEDHDKYKDLVDKVKHGAFLEDLLNAGEEHWQAGKWSAAHDAYHQVIAGKEKAPENYFDFDKAKRRLDASAHDQLPQKQQTLDFYWDEPISEDVMAAVQTTLNKIRSLAFDSQAVREQNRKWQRRWQNYQMVLTQLRGENEKEAQRLMDTELQLEQQDISRIKDWLVDYQSIDTHLQSAQDAIEAAKEAEELNQVIENLEVAVSHYKPIVDLQLRTGRGLDAKTQYQRAKKRLSDLKEANQHCQNAHQYALAIDFMDAWSEMKKACAKASAYGQIVQNLKKELKTYSLQANELEPFENALKNMHSYIRSRKYHKAVEQLEIAKEKMSKAELPPSPQLDNLIDKLVKAVKQDLQRSLDTHNYAELNDQIEISTSLLSHSSELEALLHQAYRQKAIRALDQALESDSATDGFLEELHAQTDFSDEEQAKVYDQYEAQVKAEQALKTAREYLQRWQTADLEAMQKSLRALSNRASAALSQAEVQGVLELLALRCYQREGRQALLKRGKVDYTTAWKAFESAKEIGLDIEEPRELSQALEKIVIAYNQANSLYKEAANPSRAAKELTSLPEVIVSDQHALPWRPMEDLRLEVKTALTKRVDLARQKGDLPQALRLAKTLKDFTEQPGDEDTYQQLFAELSARIGELDHRSGLLLSDANADVQQIETLVREMRVAHNWPLDAAQQLSIRIRKLEEYQATIRQAEQQLNLAETLFEQARQGLEKSLFDEATTKLQAVPKTLQERQEIYQLKAEIGKWLLKFEKIAEAIDDFEVSDQGIKAQKSLALIAEKWDQDKELEITREAQRLLNMPEENA